MAYIETRKGEFNDQFGPFRPVDGHMGKPVVPPRSCGGRDERDEQALNGNRNATLERAAQDERYRAPTTGEATSTGWNYHKITLVPGASGDLQGVGSRRYFDYLGSEGGDQPRTVQGDADDFIKQRAAIANTILWAFAVGLTFIAAVRVTVAEVPTQVHPHYVANEVR